MQAEPQPKEAPKVAGGSSDAVNLDDVKVQVRNQGVDAAQAVTLQSFPPTPSVPFLPCEQCLAPRGSYEFDVGGGSEGCPKRRKCAFTPQQPQVGAISTGPASEPEAAARKLEPGSPDAVPPPEALTTENVPVVTRSTESAHNSTIAPLKKPDPWSRGKASSSFC